RRFRRARRAGQPRRIPLGLDPLTVRARQSAQAPQSALAAGRELERFAASGEESERNAHLERPGIARLTVLDFPLGFVPIRQIGFLRRDELVGDQANLAVASGSTVGP